MRGSFFISFIFFTGFIAGKTFSKESCEGLKKNIHATESFQELLAYILPKETYEGKRQNKVRTNGLLIQYRDCVLLEEYRRGFHAQSKQLGWSTAKSVLNLIVGVAEQHGKLQRDDLVIQYYPQVQGKFRKELKIKHLLQFSSGLQWQETYEFAPFQSNVVAMLYSKGIPDMPRYISSLGFSHRPGTHWRYSSGDSTLLAAVLKAAIRPREIYEYIDTEFFSKLGVENYTFEADIKSNLVGSSYFYTSARDFAKIGDFVINGGVVKQQPLLPKDWLSFSRQIPPAFKSKLLDRGFDAPTSGAHWWTNRSGPSRSIPRFVKSAPEDMMMAFGHWGQMVVVVPSMKLVMVRFGDELYRGLSRSKSIDLLMRAIKQGGSGD